MQYIDIHSHILPDIDDGSKNLKQTMRMLQIAEENHISRIIATPHNKSHVVSAVPEDIGGVVRKIRRLCERNGMHIKIYSGNEVFYRHGIGEYLIDGKACTLAGSSYVLIEFHPEDEYTYIRNGVYELLSEGYIPILAHVERYYCICQNPEYVEALRNMGCKIQVNAGSILGNYGAEAKNFTRKILSYEEVDFIATDAHSDGHRGPYMKECARFIERKYGREYAKKILYSNAKKILEEGAARKREKSREEELKSEELDIENQLKGLMT